MTRVIGVGMGKRGRRWVRWATEAGAQVVGLVDANPDTLAAAGEELGFGVEARFTSVEQAVRALEADAVVICTPHHAHPVLTRISLELGLHVLVEKPFAQDMHQAWALVELAKARGLQMVVAQQYRYSEAVRQLQQLVHSGAIGELSGVLVQFYRWRPTKGMKLPILLNQAIHHFDGMRYIVGADPVNCMADLWDPSWNGCDGPTATEATFRFADGTRVHYSGSYVAKGAVSTYDGYWRIEGSAGQLVYDGDQSILYTPASGSEQRITVEPRKSHTCVQLCRDFLSSVQTGEPAPTSGADNLYTLAMAFAVERSAAEGRTVTLEEVLSRQGGQGSWLGESGSAEGLGRANV